MEIFQIKKRRGDYLKWKKKINILMKHTMSFWRGQKLILQKKKLVNV